VEQVSRQYADPSVSQAKFEKELESFFEQYYHWQKKGVFLIKDEFPVCEFLFLTPQLFPLAGVFAVRIDFTNYDAEPPSVKFINPYTGKLIKRPEIPFQFRQKASLEVIALRSNQDTSNGVDICIAIADEYPFICHPGIKEYHDHPFHTGNSWLRLRTEGEGRLYRILQLLHSHSIALVESLHASKPRGHNQVHLQIVQKKPS
jgi:hypothetical protein